MTATSHEVYAEVGKKTTFLVSLEWPGWCRKAKDLASAIDLFNDYRERYGLIVATRLPERPLKIIGTLKGDTTTDFGAPGARGSWDEEPLTNSQITRQCAILEQCWGYFDEVIDHSPEELRKGPRGGGRNRDAVAKHVQEAERAYGSKLSLRIAPRTPWPDQRRQIIERLLAQPNDSAWTSRYSLRRIAWHLTDHAWEIEDRSVVGDG